MQMIYGLWGGGSSVETDPYEMGSTIALQNLKNLSLFTVGDLPVIDWNAKLVAVDNRYAVTRNSSSWFQTAFDPKFIERVFKVAMNALRDPDLFFIDESGATEIKKIFLPALEGVKKIQQTYTQNPGSIYSGKRVQFALDLKGIVDQYTKLYEALK